MFQETVQVLERLLRSPSQIAKHCAADEDPRALFLASLCATLLGAAAFGGVLATSRGGLQLLYSATKVPLALVITLVLVVPALHGLAASLGQPLRLSAVVSLALAATGRAALVLLALSPVVWLALDRGIGYHSSVLLAAACYALAGLSALGLLWHGVGKSLRGAFVIACFGLVLVPTGAQTAWLLRPFIGRPAQARVPFLRHRESSFADAMYLSALSSQGIYRAPEPNSHPAPRGATNLADDAAEAP
jgi:hypothetical protein